MRHRKQILQGAVAGFILAVAFAGAWATRPLTSTAVLRVNPPVIPERFVSAQPGLDATRVVPALAQTLTSRSTLANLINNYNLYPSARDRNPVDDLVDRMREEIRIEAGDVATVRVSFSYPEAAIAQKVTADLVSRMITEYTRTRTQQAVLTFQFMKDQAQTAAMAWEESLAAVREAEASGKSVARALLDAEIARQRYEALSTKAADADMSANMERRMQGHTLELLDPASLPVDSRPSVLAAAVVGPIAGGLVGWLVSVVLGRRLRLSAVGDGAHHAS